MPKRINGFRNLLSDGLDIPEEMQPFLPRGFQRIGHVAILNLRPEVSGLSEQIAALVLENLPYVKTVCLSGGISGSLREPSVTWLAGDPVTETTHQENRCRFRLDVTRVMLSKGNITERGRVPKLVRPGETVADLFAGIGYFSIPIARNAKPARVYSVEKNPASFRYLRENIRINRVQATVTPILGDCTEVNLGSVADRVLMGYLPRTREFLSAAFRALKPQGGVIHYHDNFHDSELWEKPLDILESAAFRHGYSLKRIARQAVVKEHSPRVFHAVIDAEFRSCDPCR